MKFVKFMYFMLLFSVSLLTAEGLDRDKIDSLKRAINYDESNTSETNSEFDEENYLAQMDSTVVFEDGKAVDTVTVDETTTENELFDDGIFYNQYLDFGERDKFYSREEVDTNPLVRFGDSFIKSLKNNFPRFGPVSASYHLGLGDEIVISVWGEVQTNERLKVDRLGKITPRGLGAVHIAGKTLVEVRKSLINKYSRIYSGVRYGRNNATTFVDISMGALRTKQVFVVGSVQSPGTYSIPATAGVLGALAYSGGPNGNGSLREIYIKRNGKIIDTVDTYDYLLSGNINDSLALADFDVIVVPNIQKRVAIGGAVYSPAIYELKKNEGYHNLLQFCGGYLPEAYTRSFNATRTVSQNQRTTITVFDSDTLTLHSNDSLVIPFVDEVVNTVSIEGAVQRPGHYGIYEGMTLHDLIGLASGVNEDYFHDRAEVVRTYENFDKQIISVKIQDLIEDSLSSENVVLQKWDIVKIYSKWDIQYRNYVSIYGEVKKPGKYFLRDSMTVQDLILLAGGFTDKAFKDTVELSRVTSTNRAAGNITKSIPIRASKNFYKENGEALVHMDNLFVRENSTIKEQSVVYLKGEFSYPGFYSKQSDEETLLSLIKRAGGIKQSAYLEGATFTRAKDNIGVVALQIKSLIEKENNRDDIILEDGDTLFIPTVPKTVVVDGAVNYPTAVKFEPGKSIRYYLNRAGGFSSLANKKSIYVILANGEVREVKKRSRIVNAGSAIVIPELTEIKERFNWAVFATTLLAITSSTLTILLTAQQLQK